MEKKGESFILAKFDVSGIQEYIFASNRLRENAGASFQVTRILETLLPQAFQEAALLSKMSVVLDWKDEEDFRLPEEENIGAEILYIGGGNAVAVFRDRELFREVGRNFGIKIAKECPGIYLAVAFHETGLQDFEEDMKALDRHMEEVKRKMVRQPSYAPFPVVEQDNASHQPITCCLRQGDKAENMTIFQFQKRNAYKQIRNYEQLFPELVDGGIYEYPQDMDKLCPNHGENSTIAVIHIDGNGMGDRIKKKLKEHKEYFSGVTALRKESKEIAQLFKETYAKVLQILWDRQVFLDSEEGEDGTKGTEKTFPLRPILMDGDDLTILCAADLAIPIAAVFLYELFQKQVNEKVKITACAGIAFVHSHFPFYVAYSIAEESCSNAKRMWYDQKARQGSVPVMSCLDFQVIKDSEAGPYKGNKELKKRPYAICPDGNDKNLATMENLYATLKRLEEWPSNRRHKIYQALLSGENAMELLKQEFLSRGFSLAELLKGEYTDSPLFDALELWGKCRLDLLMDFFKIDQEVDK